MAEPANASGLFLSDQQVIAHLRSKGLIGPIDAKFIAEIRWGLVSRAFMTALAEPGSPYPNSAAGHEAFIGEMLAMSTDEASRVPKDAAVRLVCERTAEILKAQFGREEAA